MTLHPRPQSAPSRPVVSIADDMHATRASCAYFCPEDVPQDSSRLLSHPKIGFLTRFIVDLSPSGVGVGLEAWNTGLTCQNCWSKPDQPNSLPSRCSRTQSRLTIAKFRHVFSARGVWCVTPPIPSLPLRPPKLSRSGHTANFLRVLTSPRHLLPRIPERLDNCNPWS